jgi:hypothetical protein
LYANVGERQEESRDRSAGRRDAERCTLFSTRGAAAVESATVAYDRVSIDRRSMVMRQKDSFVLRVGLMIALGSIATTGCVEVKAPEEIHVNQSPGRAPLDTSRIPPTQSHEEARQRLAEAYQRIQYLEAKVRDLDRDKQELKRERDEYEDRYDQMKDRYED